MKTASKSLQGWGNKSNSKNKLKREIVSVRYGMTEPTAICKLLSKRSLSNI